MTLSQLKTKAEALGLTRDYVSHFGSLGAKATYEAAILAAGAPVVAKTTVKPMETSAAPVLVVATGFSVLARLVRGPQS